MTRLDVQQVVFCQMFIPLCVREIRDVKQEHLHAIVVDTGHLQSWIHLVQTDEGLEQEVVFV